MSVLVEALTLVVPKQVLDVSYPAGADAFLQALLELENPPRYVCRGDPHLINASFYDPEHLEPATALLSENGIVLVDDDAFVEIAIIDQRFGPTMPCDWLEWRQHADGFTLAWKAGTAEGDMATPDEWTPAQSLGLVRQDVRDEPGRCLRIGEEDGLEIWLDFLTGSMTKGLPHREAAGETVIDDGEDGSMAKGSANELKPVILQALEMRGWNPASDSDEVLHVTLDGKRATYQLQIAWNDEMQVVGCYCVLPTRIPKVRRPDVVQLINRVNWDMLVANFEMDESDGELRCRAVIDVEGGQLAPKMVLSLIDAAVTSSEMHHDDIMQAAFTGSLFDLAGEGE